MVQLQNEGVAIIANRVRPKVGDVFTVVQLVVVFNIPSALVKFRGKGAYIPHTDIPNFEKSVGKKFKIVDEVIKYQEINNFVVRVRRPIIKPLD
jgi:hypothetical protein